MNAVADAMRIAAASRYEPDLARAAAKDTLCSTANSGSTATCATSRGESRPRYSLLVMMMMGLTVFAVFSLFPRGHSRSARASRYFERRSRAGWHAALAKLTSVQQRRCRQWPPPSARRAGR
jgi:hypothetical protein